MATEVLMPKLGLTMTEGTIEEWKFKEGDTVKKGDILFSVATDKLTNDVEAEEDGTLLKILLPEGETAPCKSVIAGSAPPERRFPMRRRRGSAAPAAAPAPPLLLLHLPRLQPPPQLVARRPLSSWAAAPAAMWLPSGRPSWAPK